MMAKVITNGLKGVFHKCISNNQFVFIYGLSIIDNAMMDIELVRWMKSKTWGKECDVAHKLDISKARDRIYWRYLRILCSLWGFPKSGFVGLWCA